MRFVFAALALTLLGACSGHGSSQSSPEGRFYPQRDARFEGETAPPVAQQNNACLLLAHRPAWREVLAEVKRVWHIRPSLVLAFMYQESRFDPTAISNSQAFGFAQVKAPTWHWYELKRGRKGVFPNRFDDAADFIGWYLQQNLATNGVVLHDVKNQYLAYHEGLGGYRQESFKAKPWLVDIADKVASREALYAQQLQKCPQ